MLNANDTGCTKSTRRVPQIFVKYKNKNIVYINKLTYKYCILININICILKTKFVFRLFISNF